MNRAAGVDKRPAVPLQALHDEALAAEEAHPELALERDADRDPLCRRQKGILLRNQLAAEISEAHGDDLAGERRPERHLLSLRSAVEKHCHEQRLSSQQPLAGTHERSQQPGALLL